MSNKKTKEPVGFSIKELARVLPISENALHQRCRRMHKGKCVLYFNGFGYYSVTKPSNKYKLFLIQPDKKDKDIDSEVKEKLVDILKYTKDYVCPKCEGTIEQVIDNVK